MSNTLRVKYSDYKTDLTFNEWAIKLNVSALWDEATNERNREFIERYRNYRFAESFPKQAQTHELAV